MPTAKTDGKISYEQFRDAWLDEIEQAALSPLDKGRFFASKLITQWLGVTTDDDDFVICDGARDGGIDVAYLKRADIDVARDEEAEEGDTWYLFQSKYGSAFTGVDTILEEGRKVIATLLGQNQNLAGETRQLLEKVDLFRQKETDADRIILVFATVNPVTPQDRQAFDDIKAIGKERVTQNFDVEGISLLTIWEALDEGEPAPLSVPIKGQFVEQYSGLLVGTVGLIDLFDFLQSYKKQTGNLDQLYEKNVRQFLGDRRKINKGIKNTLETDPEKFGLYNNGITIVVSGYRKVSDDVTMDDPYVVNGCQTTRTIGEVLGTRLNPGGSGDDSVNAAWKKRVARGSLVTKIVRSEEAEIANITKFTNSQNSVRAQDFLALQEGIQRWKSAMESDYNIFLEIQRGGEASRKAYEKQHPDLPKFDHYVNAFDLIKVYGAGWLAAPGLAFGKNAPFLPKGSIYEKIMSAKHIFGARDLYAAYKVKCVADDLGFGRGASHPSRRQSRFLFYHIIMRMLGNVIRLTPELDRPSVSPVDLTDAVLNLTAHDTPEQFEVLANGAVALIGQYLTPGASSSGNTAFSERSYIETHAYDLNAFLKAENLGKDSHSPKLGQLLDITNTAFEMSGGRRQVADALVASVT